MYFMAIINLFNEQASKQANERANEWVREWMNEWAGGQPTERPYLNKTFGLNLVSVMIMNYDFEIYLMDSYEKRTDSSEMKWKHKFICAVYGR